MTQTLLLSPPSLEYSQNYFPFSSLSQLSKHPINFGVLLTFSFGDHGVRKSFYCTFSKTPNWLKLELDFKGTWHIQHTIAGFPVKASEYIIRIIFSVHSKHAVSPELSPSLKYHATADLKADKEIKNVFNKYKEGSPGIVWLLGQTVMLRTYWKNHTYQWLR